MLFFDEAHLLFDDMPPALTKQIEQVVRLIRSKGVGVYFVTQNPLDLPDTILGQLGNRIQHALRAFTPRDQKAVKSAAETFRSNENLNVAEVISELGVGEALVSFLDEKGMPSVVERAYILPPSSQLPPLDARERDQAYQGDVLYHYYKDKVDNYSAFEALNEEKAKAEQAEQATNTAKAQATTQQATQQKSGSGALEGFLGGLTGGRKKSGQGTAYNVADALGSQINKQATKAISRGLMGVIKNLLK